MLLPTLALGRARPRGSPKAGRLIPAGSAACCSGGRGLRGCPMAVHARGSLGSVFAPFFSFLKNFVKELRVDFGVETGGIAQQESGRIEILKSESGAGGLGSPLS